MAFDTLTFCRPEVFSKCQLKWLIWNHLFWGCSSPTTNPRRLITEKWAISPPTLGIPSINSTAYFHSGSLAGTQPAKEQSRAPQMPSQTASAMMLHSKRGKTIKTSTHTQFSEVSFFGKDHLDGDARLYHIQNHIIQTRADSLTPNRGWIQLPTSHLTGWPEATFKPGTSVSLSPYKMKAVVSTLQVFVRTEFIHIMHLEYSWLEFGGTEG